jgi:hypothetical protein
LTMLSLSHYGNQDRQWPAIHPISDSDFSVEVG